MKLTYAALAAVGVSACPFDIYHHSEHNMKAMAVDVVYKPLFGSHIKDNCEEKPEKMVNGVFYRKWMQAVNKKST